MTLGWRDEFVVPVSTRALMVVPFDSLTGTDRKLLLLIKGVGLEFPADARPLTSAARSFPAELIEKGPPHGILAGPHDYLASVLGYWGTLWRSVPGVDNNNR